MPLKSFGKARTSRCRHHDRVEFLFFGNIDFYKGLDLLIKAVADLKSEFDNFQVTIAGRCDDWDNKYGYMIDETMPIKSKIGFVDNAEISTLFNSCHYLVLPYRDATQSGPLLIAFNYNVPVIASDLEYFQRNIIEGTNGFLFQKNDYESLKDIMRRILTSRNTGYSELRHNMAEFVKKEYAIEHSIKSLQFLETL
jgi:glycosyltransferase involved in cell wall biosynthesis